MASQHLINHFFHASVVASGIEMVMVRSTEPTNGWQDGTMRRRLISFWRNSFNQDWRLPQKATIRLCWFLKRIHLVYACVGGEHVIAHDERDPTTRKTISIVFTLYARGIRRVKKKENDEVLSHLNQKHISHSPLVYVWNSWMVCEFEKKWRIFKFWKFLIAFSMSLLPCKWRMTWMASVFLFRTELQIRLKR